MTIFYRLKNEFILSLMKTNLRQIAAGSLLLFASCLGFSQQMVTAGNAVALGGDCYRLVDTFPGQKGAIWSPDTVDLANGFDITFHTMIARPSVPGGGWSADGFAFVLQSTGTTALGGGGNGIGYGQTLPTMSTPINPSVAIEVDTWDNQVSGVDDTSFDHMAVHINGNLATAASGPVEALVGGASVDILVGGAPFCRKYRVTWDPASNTMNIYYNGVLRITYVNNIVNNVFSGNSKVLAGITAANGSINSYVRVCYEFAHAGNDTNLCSSDTLQLNASTGVLFQWNDSLGMGGMGLSNNNTANPQFVAVTTPSFVSKYKYFLTVINQFGCMDEDTMRIEVEEALTIPDAGPDSTLCTSAPLNLYGNALTQLGQWQFISGPVTPTLPSPFFQNTAVQNAIPGTYQYSWGYVSPPVLCESPDDTVNFTIALAPAADAGSPVQFCLGDPVTLTGDTTGSPVFAHVINWNPALYVTDPDSLTTAASPDTTMYFYLTVTDTSTGCAAFDSVLANLHSMPVIDSMSNDTFICLGDSINIFCFHNFLADSFVWNPNGPIIGFAGAPSPLVSPLVSTNFVITAYATLNDCYVRDSIQIDVFGAQVSISASDTMICRGDTVDLFSGAAAAADLSWSSAPATWIEGPDSIDTRAAPMLNTWFFAGVQDTSSFCPLAGDSVLVNVQTIAIDVDPVFKRINPGQSVDLITVATPSNSASLTFDWTPPDDFNSPLLPNPVVTPASSGPDESGSFTYTLTVTDPASGCSNDTTIVIELDPFERPNVFTPNGDGYNDLLFVNYWGRQIYHAAVFDRWGNMLFETDDPHVNWNGATTSGKEATAGVYYLVLEIIEDPSIPDSRKNDAFHVMLLR